MLDDKMETFDALSDQSLLQLVERGDEDTQFQYALRCYEQKIKGQSKEQQYQIAMQLFLPLAEKGNVDAQFYCGRMLFFGQGIETNHSEGLMYLYRAAEQGNGRALNQIGRLYEHGYEDVGLVKDLLKAKEYYERASETGFSPALNNLGYCYENFAECKDQKRAIQYYQKAVELGNEQAAENLAQCYRDGRGVEPDIKMAIHYFTLAAQKGYVVSQRSLGYIYGWNEKCQNFQLSKKWCEEAAAQGDAIGANNLGVIYEEGRGVPADPALAMTFYLQAVEKGYAPAQCAVGRLCEKCSQYKQAENWYQKAAAQKNVTAMNNLGVLYGEGYLGTPDYVKAIAYCTKAAEAGSQTAKRNVDIYRSALAGSTQQIPQNATAVHCPKCKSTQISAKAKGFGFGKAVVGTALLGQIGALAGTIGSGKTQLVCHRCGHVWTPNSLSSAITEYFN